MSDLENLRKRAKQLVRDHHRRSYAVTERIRLALPRFAGLTDREVLDAPFALHDAQQVVAAELGFVTWADIKEAAPMPAPVPSAPLRFQRALAQVFVRDVTAALDYYRDVLGFDVVFTYGEPPFYAEVARDGAAFNLRHTDASPWVPDTDEPDLLAVAVVTSDAKALFLEYQAAGVELHQRLKEEYGGRSFIVRDPDGNLLLFGSTPQE